MTDAHRRARRRNPWASEQLAPFPGKPRVTGADAVRAHPVATALGVGASQLRTISPPAAHDALARPRKSASPHAATIVGALAYGAGFARPPGRAFALPDDIIAEAIHAAIDRASAPAAVDTRVARRATAAIDTETFTTLDATTCSDATLWLRAVCPLPARPAHAGAVVAIAMLRAF